MLGAPGKLASEHAKLPVRVTLGANTPLLPSVVSCVPVIVHVAPGWAHLVQPEGASAAAKTLLDSASANAPKINFSFIFVSIFVFAGRLAPVDMQIAFKFSCFESLGFVRTDW